MTAPQTPEKSERPGVTSDERSAPFFEGAERAELMILRCNGCQAWLAPQTRMCTECLGEDLAWTAASGRGTVHTFGFMHQLFHPGFRDEMPYNVAVIELEEGPRIQSNIVDCPADEIRVDMPVKAVFVRAGEAMIPKFAPA